MLYPTVRVLLENDTLENFQKLLYKETELYKKLNECHSKLDEMDNDYNKGLINEDGYSSLESVIENDIEEYTRQIQFIEDEEYKLLDNLETLL